MPRNRFAESSGEAGPGETLRAGLQPRRGAEPGAVLPLEVAGQDRGVVANLGEQAAGLLPLALAEEDAGEPDLGLDNRAALQQLAQHGLDLVAAAGLVQAAGEVEGALAEVRVRLHLHQLIAQLVRPPP